MNGIIKTKTDKGFGFISREGESKDVFFHSSALVGISFDEVTVGMAVTFDVEAGAKGPSAKNVQVAQQAKVTKLGEVADLDMAA
jgi:cold shock protein